MHFHFIIIGEYVSVLQSQTSSSSRGTDATSNTVPSRILLYIHVATYY